jgi:glucan biosynthesis protein C
MAGTREQRDEYVEPTVVASPAARSVSTGRLYYLDNLRVALTALVIAHHVGQAYGPTGGWWPVQEATRAAVLGPFFTVNRSFFMSLFFMISGYLMVLSYDRNKPGTFVKGRLRRLGVPLAIWGIAMALMLPLVFHTTGPAGSILYFGPLWYVEHLLLLSLVYALWRILWKRPLPTGRENSPVPGPLAILPLALGIAVASGVVRIWYPIDRWINLLGFIQVAPADVPRDLAMFVVGALAYRRQWFQRFPARAGYAWLGVGLGAAVLWYVYALFLYPLVHLPQMTLDIIYLLWEGLLCCGMCIGLLVLFREMANRQGALGQKLARGQYAAYVYHVPLVLGLQFLALSLPLPPLADFCLVTAAGIPLVFLLSYWLRKSL